MNEHCSFILKIRFRQMKVLFKIFYLTGNTFKMKFVIQLHASHKSPHCFIGVSLIVGMSERDMLGRYIYR